MLRWLPERSASVAVKRAAFARAEAEAKKAGKKLKPVDPDPFDPVQFHGWDTDRFIAVRTANEVISANYMTQAINSPKGKKPDEPTFVEVPGQAKPKKPSGISMIRAQRERQLNRG